MSPFAFTAGPRRRSTTERRHALRQGLTAASPPRLLPTYEWTQGDTAGFFFSEHALRAGFTAFTSAEWPCEAKLDTAGAAFIRDDSAVIPVGPGLALVHCGHGWFSVTVAAPTYADASKGVAIFRAAYPPLYQQAPGEDVVPITFWTLGAFGPTRRLRMIESAAWNVIRRNYTGSVQAEIDRLTGEAFEPGSGGQLLLWQGPPGTGKTWALRALASAWRPWAEFHYITDPDAFFIRDPSYMIDVLLAETYEALTPDDDLVAVDDGGTWRVLILEDTGELLAANAKESQGQGLSRLLNVVDGMVGQGLRVLTLVTTNDELGDLHPAVMRPGRCASRIEFDALTEDEATTWLGTASPAATLAELYARTTDSADPLPDDDEWEGPDEEAPDDGELEELVEFARSPLDV